jgi:hypothetical protein
MNSFKLNTFVAILVPYSRSLREVDSLLHVLVYTEILSGMAEECLPIANQGWNKENISDLIEMLNVDNYLPSPLRGYPTYCLLSPQLLPKYFFFPCSFYGQ